MTKDEWRREQGCTRKRAFQTKFYAEAYARNVLGEPHSAYRCKYCREWHLARVINNGEQNRR